MLYEYNNQNFTTLESAGTDDMLFMLLQVQVVVTTSTISLNTMDEKP